MSWSEIRGQELIKGCLARLVQTGRIGGTYLFYGPAGSDQEPIASGFVASILCEQGDGDSCGVCRSCRGVRDRIHPDLFVLEPEGAFYKIDQLRAMQTMALSSPFVAARKVFVLRQAERMQAVGANSLLKILEEPYEHSLFILLTDNLARLLPTIVSRCQRVRLAPLPPEELAEELVATEGVSREKAEALARISGGRLGRAKELLGEAWLQRRDELVDLLEALRTGSRLEIVHRSQAWSRDRAAARERLVALLGLLRDALILASGGRRELLFNVDRIDAIASVWAGVEVDQVMAAFEAAVDGLDGLDRNLNVQNVLEEVFIACSGIQPAISRNAL